MEAIITAVLSAFGGVSNIITSNQQAKYGRLPQWANPRDYQRKNNTLLWITLGIVAAFIIIILATAIVVAKKK